MSDKNFSGSIGVDTHIRIGNLPAAVSLTSSLDGTQLIVNGEPITGQGSANYDTKTSIYMPTPTALQSTRAALARARNGGLACRVLCKGDSTTFGTNSGTNPGSLGPRAVSWVDRARRTLNSSQVFGGANLVREGALFNIVAANDPDSRFVLGTGWSSTGGFWQAGTGATGSLTFTDDGSSGQQCDSFDIWVQYGAGNTTFTYTINGGAQQTVDISTLGAFPGQYRTRTITTTAGSANVLAIQKPAAGTLNIAAVQPINTTVPHVMDLTRVGVSGQTLASFASSFAFGGVYYPYVPGFLPDLVILWLGINDGHATNTSTSLATYATNLASIIVDIQNRGIDVALVTFPDFGYFNGATLATAPTEAKPWHAAIYTAANTYGCAVIDLANRWGYNVKPLLASGNNLSAGPGTYLLYDGVHPSLTGYQDIGQMIATFLGAQA